MSGISKWERYSLTHSAVGFNNYFTRLFFTPKVICSIRRNSIISKRQ